jgi:hypothetical protein
VGEALGDRQLAVAERAQRAMGDVEVDDAGQLGGVGDGELAAGSGDRGGALAQSDGAVDLGKGSGLGGQARVQRPAAPVGGRDREVAGEGAADAVLDGGLE